MGFGANPVSASRDSALWARTGFAGNGVNIASTIQHVAMDFIAGILRNPRISAKTPVSAKPEYKHDSVLVFFSRKALPELAW